MTRKQGSAYATNVPQIAKCGDLVTKKRIPKMQEACQNQGMRLPIRDSIYKLLLEQVLGMSHAKLEELSASMGMEREMDNEGDMVVPQREAMVEFVIWGMLDRWNKKREKK